jgi:hypothetical protein
MLQGKRFTRCEHLFSVASLVLPLMRAGLFQATFAMKKMVQVGAPPREMELAAQMLDAGTTMRRAQSFPRAASTQTGPQHMNAGE